MDGIQLQVGGEYDTLSGSLGTLGFSFVPPVVGTDDMIDTSTYPPMPYLTELPI